MNEWVLFDGGGRGRPRSDRRAFVYPVRRLLFDDCNEEGFAYSPVVVTSSDTETSHLSLHPGQAGERSGRICQPSARQFALVKPPRLSFAD